MKIKTTETADTLRENFSEREKEEGITLVALIITIIVLIILAAVTILTLTETNLLHTAEKGTENYASSQEYEKQIMNDIDKKVNDVIRNIASVQNGTNIEEQEPDIPVEPEEVLTLFDSGEQFNDRTGGWHGRYSDGTVTNYGSTEISETLTIKTTGTWCAYVIQTTNKIDLSDYSKLVMKVENTSIVGEPIWCGFYFGATDITLGDSRKENYNIDYTTYNESEPKELEYDISHINEELYIFFGASNGRTISISKVYLKK